MGNNECCGRIKEDEENMMHSTNERVIPKDIMPLRFYDIKPYAQVINNMCRDMISLDTLLMLLSMAKDSEVTHHDSELMKQLSKLPGQNEALRLYERVSLICLGLLFCDGTA